MVETLEQLLDLSKEILEAAQQKHWERVATLQQERAHKTDLLNQMSTPTDKTSSLKAEALIKAIKELDEKITPLLLEEQEATLKARQKTNKGKRMNQAYQSLNR